MVRVGVFPAGKRGFTAYTVWFSEEWEGCCVHHVEPPQISAKKRAIIQHKEVCLRRRETRNDD